MKTRPGARLLLSGLVALALVAAACGGDGDDNATLDGGGDLVAPAEGDVDLDATFVYAYPITVSRLDPHRAQISQDGTTLYPAYDRLVHVAPDGELIPGLAESWAFSDDGLVLTMQLRDGVIFHDGATFDAEAAKASLDRAVSIEGSSVATDLRSLAEVTVVDPMTIALTLTEPNVAIVGALSDRAGIQISPDAIVDGVDLDERMVGAGPFRMVSHTPGASTVFERFEDYWDADQRAQVAQLEIRVMADQVSRFNALSQGEIDATTLGANQVADAETLPGVELVMSTELQYLWLAQNRARAGQDQLAVRQALIHAIDRESICESLLFGNCVLSDQPFPPGYFAYNDEIDDVIYPYDPDLARELLAEAGVPDLELTMVIPAALPMYPEVSEAIQAQWAEVGVTVRLQTSEPSQIGDAFFLQQVSDTMLATWGGRPDPAITLVQRASATGFANPGGGTTPEMETLIAESLSTVDVDERREVLQEASREMAESALEIVVLFPQVAHAMADNVYLEPYLTAKPEFRTVSVSS